MNLDPVALVRRYHEALNAYDEKIVAAMFSASAVYVSPGVNGRLEGREAIIAAFNAYFAEHPGQQSAYDMVEQVAPDAARSLWRLEATKRSSGERVIRQGRETVMFDDSGLILHVEVEDR